MGDERTDTERVGQFVDGPYDTDVTLYRPDIAALMGRDGPKMDDPLRLGGPFPVIPGHKLKAATNDWVFSPFLYLWEEEPYEDPGAWRRRYAQEQATKNLSEQPFLTTVGVRTMNGLGTYYGTFISEMERFSPELRDDVKEDQGLVNFYTNPGKKGTGYGYVGLTLNPYPEYMEDPAFDFYEAHKKMREEFEAALLGEAKFIPAGAGKEYFDPNPFFDNRDPEGQIETYDFDRLESRIYEGDKPPFIPANTTKKINGNKDVMSPFEKFPSYDPSDPWEAVPANIFRNLVQDPEKPSWKAQFGNRTRQQRSIIQYNMKLWVNPTNFHLF